MFLTRAIGWASGGGCRRVILQPRGERFCNHEEENFATTRRKILQPRGGKFCNHEEVAKLGVLGGFREWVE